jgi:2-polyprenyl-3-methyl-5-hydroxy-6-metoxy-1,4-benzoquinol methylase
MGSVAGFFTHPVMMAKYDDVAGLVRRGGAADHTLAPGDPIWVEFARRMAPMFGITSRNVAAILATPGRRQKVLDVAAGHGLFGIEVALRNPDATLTFQDWDNVLDVARENASARGLADRFTTIPGSAFDVAFGNGYDVVLLPNFLHHFDRAANVALLRKVHAALKDGGRVAIVEFVPNEDRVSPPDGALFAMRMLGTTPAGDAYTLAEYQDMLHEAGFAPAEVHSLAPAPQQLIVAAR